MATVIMATLSATMIIGINGQNLQNANAQTSQPGITSMNQQQQMLLHSKQSTQANQQIRNSG